MSNINFSSTLPAAPAGSLNVAFAVDGSNDISASLPKATASVGGYLAAADFTTFAAKQNALTLPLSIANGGTGAVTAAAALLALTGAWQTWTPALTATGSGSPTFTTPTSVTALYLTVGAITFFRLIFTTTIGGTVAGGTSFTVNMPVSEALGIAASVVGLKGNSLLSLVAVTGSTLSASAAANATGTFTFTFSGFYQST